MSPSTDESRLRPIAELSPPRDIIAAIPRGPAAEGSVAAGRAALAAILRGHDDRLAVVIGPCSIHDPAAALDYAQRLAGLRARLSDDLAIVMRVYFEKPRTTVGWKGLINDPGLDDSFDIEAGLRLARRVLRDINEAGVPAGSEFLDGATAPYLADLVSWGAIGARTAESQIHRELASGLSCPVGFKNGTDGNVQGAVDAIGAAARPHRCLGLSSGGRAAVLATAGNADGHLVLRGGGTPNFDALSVEAACAALAAAGLAPRVMIDASHGNSRKNPENQPGVVEAVAAQVAGGDRRIVGMMVESHLVAGRQDHGAGRALRYGQSITDGCLGWEASVAVLERLAQAVRARRAGAVSGGQAAA